ncbi:sugar nucleotide-binding protein [Actinomadura sp. DC4]|uniref:sugar nucleotide-binding protein n=1 Tax=Actinomadura sp. DC4 TaxID=3055069 RepID=UPI0025B275D4|nr:sugar nucleotide-binding protein [Actinomadura sp. DC4]MDN3359416.1 sugar nucleotide-binding protein [Actinomadura sp. DC4]
MKPVLVVGQGLIGAAIVARLRAAGHPVVVVARRPRAGTLALDLATEEGRAELAETARRTAPRSVVLVHGPSDVTGCEDDPQAALETHEGVAAAVADAGCPVVLVSTDNVFDGERPLNRTADPVAPANAYGRAKLAAERRLNAPPHVILRVSLVYGWSGGEHRSNYAERCLRAAAAGEVIEAPGDQWFTPVHADDVAQVVAAVAAAPETAPALAHVAGPEHLNRVAFARTACEVTGGDPDLVREVPRAATIWASRPPNSSLAPSDLGGVAGLAAYRPRTPREGLTGMWRTARTAVLFGVDAGGSRTRVAVREEGGTDRRAVFGSVNPAAVGADQAGKNLHEAFRFIGDVAGERDVRGWLASATVSPETAGAELETVAGVAADAGVRGTVTVSGDMIPLLLAAPLRGAGTVVVVGTGSGLLAGDGQGRVRRAGGYEYLGSDEGSAFDLGLAGLRSACRALDGRGRPTRLVDALEEHLGADLPTAARRLAALAHPKHTVAALAPAVCATWLGGDPVAAGIVEDAVDQLASFAARLRRHTLCPPGAGTVITGGVVTGCPPFAEALGAALKESCGDHPVSAVPDATAAALDLAGEAGATRRSGVRWTFTLGGGRE